MEIGSLPHSPPRLRRGRGAGAASPRGGATNCRRSWALAASAKPPPCRYAALPLLISGGELEELLAQGRLSSFDALSGHWRGSSGLLPLHFSKNFQPADFDKNLFTTSDNSLLLVTGPVLSRGSELLSLQGPRRSWSGPSPTSPPPVPTTRLGAYFAQRNEFGCAIPAFDKSLQLDPKSWETRYNLGLALMQKGDRERASRELRLVVTQKPDLLNARNALGTLHYEMRRTSTAPRKSFGQPSSWIRAQAIHSSILDKPSRLRSASPPPSLI